MEVALGESRWVRLASRPGTRPVTTPYPLDAACRWNCQPPEAEEGELVRIDLGTPASNRSDESRPALRCEVVAVVGRDHRLFHDNP